MLKYRGIIIYKLGYTGKLEGHNNRLAKKKNEGCRME